MVRFPASGPKAGDGVLEVPWVFPCEHLGSGSGLALVRNTEVSCVKG